MLVFFILSIPQAKRGSYKKAGFYPLSSEAGLYFIKGFNMIRTKIDKNDAEKLTELEQKVFIEYKNKKDWIGKNYLLISDCRLLASG